MENDIFTIKCFIEEIKLGNDCISTIRLLTDIEHIYGKNYITKLLDTQDINGLNMIHYCVYNNIHHGLLRLIIESYSPDINCKNKEGQTPLDYAISLENDKIKSLLIQYGAEKGNIKSLA